jgi:hypothetical protein
MASDAQILIYQTLGEDATFFSGYYAKATASSWGRALPVPPGKVARCELSEALYRDHTGHRPVPLLWVQCGQVAGLDPEGEYLCQKHMGGWQCDACGALKTSYSLNGGLCDACDEN